MKRIIFYAFLTFLTCTVAIFFGSIFIDWRSKKLLEKYVGEDLVGQRIESMNGKVIKARVEIWGDLSIDLKVNFFLSDLSPAQVIFARNRFNNFHNDKEAAEIRSNMCNDEISTSLFTDGRSFIINVLDSENFSIGTIELSQRLCE